MFGWIFASHQLGAACAALVAGLTRDALGSYDAAWYGGAALCVVGAALSLCIRRGRSVTSSPVKVPCERSYGADCPDGDQPG